MLVRCSPHMQEMGFNPFWVRSKSLREVIPVPLRNPMLRRILRVDPKQDMSHVIVSAAN